MNDLVGNLNAKGSISGGINLPKGDKGDQGVSGVYVGSGDMPEGYNVQVDPTSEAKGVFPDLTIGVVETLEAGENATASVTGPDNAPVLNLGIPKGERGVQGDRGVQGERGVSGVYVGEGDMPEGYSVQVNPTGEVCTDVFVGDENTTVEEFYNADKSGKICFMRRPHGGSGRVNWVAYRCGISGAYFYNITNANKVNYGSLTTDGVWEYTTASTVFIGDANTTVEEFYNADKSGKVCFMRRPFGGSGIVNWVAYNCGSTGAHFHLVTSGGAVMYGHLAVDGTFTYETKRIPTTEDINSAIKQGTQDFVKSVDGIVPDENGNVVTEKPWVLIDDITLENDDTKIIIPNFTTKTYKEMYLSGVIGFAKTDGTTNAVSTIVTIGNTAGSLSYVRSSTGGALGTNTYRYLAQAKVMPDDMPLFEARFTSYSGHSAGSGSNENYNTAYLGGATGYLPAFSIYISTDKVCFKTGTNIKVWGR